MSDTVIKVENISKLYRLGVVGTGTLRHDFNRWWHKVRGREDPYLKIGQTNDRTVKGDSDYVWALKDVNFEVKRGEVLGIIGRNGAGKSTLLKIMSRVTTPTSGEIKVKGRIASLLEVGTGFNPELTGRDNVYLNGAILGMRKHEIARKFDEIVAFAEVERYIDTPVKRYSSGMSVRLAFAVAAHLEPEILIVDEVLAVGDAAFQKKCLGKMQDVAKYGRTIIFVSHNMQALVALCDTAVWLQGGKLLETGASRKLIGKYIEKHAVEGLDKNLPLAKRPRSGSGSARFTNLTVISLGMSGQETEHIITGSSIRLDLEIKSDKWLKDANVAVTIYDTNNYRLIDINTALKGEFLSLMPGDKAEVSFVVKELLLKPGRYTIELWLGRGGIEDADFIKDAGAIEVYDDIAIASHSETFPGVYQCNFTHQIIKRNNAKSFETAKESYS
ncbi:MAG: ABC transporter ATP-binding protein [Verrucomicrobiota bacterium]|jgi:lipopolysaccharide transport system ATP-binding protein